MENTAATPGAPPGAHTAFCALADQCGVVPAVADSAFERLSTGQAHLFGYSGWQGSGKDTVAVAVNEALGLHDVRHLYYADALKNEVDLVFEAIRDAGDTARAIAAVSEQFAAPVEAATRIVAIIGPALWADHNRELHARCRTEEVRDALQYWGTDFRRAQDPDYWVKLALGPAIVTIGEGHDAYFSDVRFVNEVVGCQRVGFVVVRLEVSVETQRQRLMDRDGFIPGPEKLHHASEHDLDDYDGFDLVIDNNGELADAVGEIVAAQVDRQVAA